MFGQSADALIEDRFRSVRALLTFIRSNESVATPPVDGDEVKILRGLFFVHLYGAFEKSVTEVIHAYLRKIAEIDLVYAHIECKMWPSALDARFSSLQVAKGKDAWQKRKEFSAIVESENSCAINEGMFSDRLQNARPEVLEDIFSALGLRADFMLEGVRLSLTEVVEKRNQVAHGRAEPQAIGSGSTSRVLEERMNTLYSLSRNILESMRAQLGEMSFVREPHRTAYSQRLAPA